MYRTLTILMICIYLLCGWAGAADPGHSAEFSSENGHRTVRLTTHHTGYCEAAFDRKLPIRNPGILAEVLWVDRNHENAIAEDVTVTPDGSNIFAGWWLNNERFSAYASPGMDSPVWTYREVNDWQMPVASSNDRFGGTGTGLPGYVWDQDSPLFEKQFDYQSGYAGKGVSFSGDGSLIAMTASQGSNDAVLLVYDLEEDDTVFTSQFVPITGQYGVDFSYDGSTVVVSNYGGLLVYSVPDGELIGTIDNYSQNTARISGDGSLIVIGTFNGTFYLYEWDGSEYSLFWSDHTDHDWVTAVGVSRDGSTAACGTLDFQSGQIAGGKFMMWDVPSGEVLIDYDEYGDEVGSVALSADGQYAVAACWGQYGSTFGDVVTCFTRDTDVPIFQLLDDIDESGSIFDVSISETGRYAAAGGKAVHAREWGNGGMLYSIMIRDPLANDVAVASIDEPGEFVNPGEQVIPTATYINVGNESANFTTRCIVTEIDTGEDIYNSSFDVEDLGSFETSIVYFSPDFEMPGEGRYKMEFSAEMESDEDSSNNDLGLVLRSWHDIRATAAVSPFDEVTVEWPMSAVATFRNLGSYYENVDIQLEIYDTDENVVFSTISTIYGMAPYMEEEVVFDAWIPEVQGEYRAEFNAILPDDYFPDDNFIAKSFNVVREMIYDDGVADVSIWVNAYPYSLNRKFGQRFEPNVAAPFSISNMRVFIGPVNYDGTLDYIQFTPESNGIPDTVDYYEMIYDPPLAGPNSWSSFDLNIPVDGNNPLWVVIHWPDQEGTGPYIGGDNTGVQEGQSYWYADGEEWNQYPLYDWMIRMTLDEQTGNEYEFVAGLPDRVSLSQNYPNPFNPGTRIDFALPNSGDVKIEIFSTLGRKVKVVADEHFDAGYHSVNWDGRSGSGDEVSSGVYYYRLTSGDYRISRKMILLR